jgi:glycosyltransferase involved in cell wall biosynthesis
MTTPEAEPRKPRLLVVSSTYPRWSGDPEPGFVHGLVRGLLPTFEVLVVSPHAPGAATDEVMDGVQVRRHRYAPSKLERLVNDGGIMGNLRRSRWKWLLVPGFLVSQIVAIRSVRRRWRPDAIHAHWLVPAGLAATLAGGRIPLVVTSHGTDLYSLRSSAMVRLKLFVAKRAAALTVVSTPMRSELERIGADPAKIDVIPMGVDLRARFSPDPRTMRSVDEILFVGRLTETKGLRHLVAAMPAVLAARPSAHLTIVGFGPELEERKAQANALGVTHRIRFEGAVPQSDLPAFYRRAAVLAAPFEEAGSGAREGLGLVMVEALGCGCPVVTTCQPATGDVFGAAEPAGLAEPGSSASLASALVRVLDDPISARAATAALRDSVVERFDSGHVASRYSDLLREPARPQAPGLRK